MSAVDTARDALTKAESVRDYETRALDGAQRNVDGCEVRSEKAKRDLEHAASAREAALADRDAVGERLAAAENAVEEAKNVYDQAVAEQAQANAPAADNTNGSAQAGVAEGQSV